MIDIDYYRLSVYRLTCLKNIAGSDHTEGQNKCEHFWDKRISEKTLKKTKTLINIEGHLAKIEKLAEESRCYNRILPEKQTLNKLQEMINQYAWNRPASWPLNVRQAAKIKIYTVRV